MEHILPSGVVCDGCNNYIAREVEKPLVDSAYFRERRFNAWLPSKKGRIPPIEGIHLQSLTKVQLIRTRHEPYTGIGTAPDIDDGRWVKSIMSKQPGSLIIPVSVKPADYVVSRFIGKVGMEVLAHRLMNVPGGLDEIVDKPELDELRQYVRRGFRGSVWPCSCRPLYVPDALFNDGGEEYQLLHEFDILVTDEGEFYVVVAIFGDEYVLNLGGPELEGYQRWLKKNGSRSPLYCGKNS